jgi:hypothetical protein
VTRWGGTDHDRWKPEGFEDFKTRGEVAEIVNRHWTRLDQLERAGKIGKPITVKCGRLQVRLYSPEEVDRIKRHFQQVEGR